MEVHLIENRSSEEKKRSLGLKMALGFLAGFVGVMLLAACMKGMAKQSDLGVPMVQRASVSPLSVAGTAPRGDAWVTGVRLRKRDRQAEKHRLYNRAIKSAVRTRTKKALRSIEDAKKAGISSEADLKDSDKLMSEAYKEIDKAITKGVMKQNTGSRTKSRIATWRKKVLIESGLYTPVEEVAAAAQ
eukprot:CAMPEP_0167753306 /NCGR_PEP_ID=MMETSP0110_2-20121227/7634_1 /TAXON_ID=629695 /ORGANISM="Gymnochlora sp., Strain CCMP2014" /LENGTH=186 /DNA_ID=CAMNT_0007639045 /DNA_START=56 /DNA_END=616 /DNA_ORIENTATION=+